MAFLREVLGAECALLIAALGAVTAWKFVRAGLRRGGFRALWDPASRGGLLGWQMGLTTVVVALLYLFLSLGAAVRGALPPVPRAALVVLGLSNIAWLGGAVRRRLRRADNPLN